MFDSTAGHAREHIDITERDVESMKESGTVVVDTSRRRPLYFDGRFLAASDLSMEQNYIISRQSTLGRALGGGIIDGLLVDEGDDARSVYIGAGHGLTRAGEMVMLPEDIQVSLAEVEESQRLNVAFGLSEIAKAPAANRTGLFILALRPVEYTANPIAVYPTSVTGKPSGHRSSATGEVITQDGDIVSAVAISLIPYQDLGTTSELKLRRASAAREIFVDGKEKGFASGVLPLAMLALESGVIAWIDNDMVRRHVGNEHKDVLGLGFAPRGLREAYFRQYESHLRYIMDTEGQSSTKRFSASDYFFALPACGPMPTSSINPDDFSQSFFPAEMEVDLSIIPDDELAPLIDESLLLPPIDLSLSGEDFESSSIMVLIPVSRSRLRELSSQLSSMSRDLQSTAPGQNSRKNPLEALYELNNKYQAPSLIEGVIGEDSWRELLTINDVLWYVRRRNISYKAEIASLPVSGSGGADPGEVTPPGNEEPPTNEEPPVVTPPDVFELPGAVRERVVKLGLTESVATLVNSSSSTTQDMLAEFLSQDGFRNAPDLMFYAAVSDLVDVSSNAVLARSRNNLPNNVFDKVREDKTNTVKKVKAKLTLENIKQVARRFDYKELGKGIRQFEESNEALKGEVYLSNLGRSKLVPEFDQVLISTKNLEMIKELAHQSEELLLKQAKDQYLRIHELIKELIEKLADSGSGKQPPLGGGIPDKKEEKEGGEKVTPKDKPEVMERPKPPAEDKKVDAPSIPGVREEIKKTPKEKTKKVAPSISSIEAKKKEEVNKTERPLQPENGIVSENIELESKRFATELKLVDSISLRLVELSLANNYQQLSKKASNENVRDLLRALVSSSEIKDSPNIVLIALLDELAKAAKKANNRITKSIVTIAEQNYKNAELAKGMVRLEKLEPGLVKTPDYNNILGRSGMIPELSDLVLAIDKKSELKDISAELLGILESNKTKKIPTVQVFIRRALKKYNVKS